MREKIYLAMYLGRKKENKSADWLDIVTCFFTRSRYSHAELVYDYAPVSGIGHSWSSSPRDGGMRGATINFKSGHWELFEIESSLTVDEILTWFNDRGDLKYDYFGALGVVFPFFKGKKGRYYCFEAIAESLGFLRDYLTADQLLELFPTRKRII